MSLNSREDLLMYIEVFQQDAFHEPVIRQVKGKNQITAQLVGTSSKTFPPARAPYTRQFLRHMPAQEPKELKAAHDNKQAPKNPKGRRKALPKTSSRNTRKK